MPRPLELLVVLWRRLAQPLKLVSLLAEECRTKSQTNRPSLEHLEHPRQMEAQKGELALEAPIQLARQLWWARKLLLLLSLGDLAPAEKEVRQVEL